MKINKVYKNYSARDRILSTILILSIVLILLVNIFNHLSYKYKIFNSKQTYSEGVVGELNIINPLFRDSNTINRDLTKLIYSGLTKYNPSTKNFEPDLATFTVENNLKYTFTLKEDIKWHDKTPLTSEDILFTYQTLIKNPNFNNTILKQSFDNVEINMISTSSIEFILPAPNSFFLSLTDIGILPQHILSNTNINEIGDLNSKIIGTGPFRLNNIDILNKTTTKVSLKPFNQYYEGKPKIKEFKYFIFNTEQELIKNLEILNSIPNLNFQLSETNHEYQVQNYTLPQYTAIFFNLNNQFLQERNNRVAIKRTIDQIEIDKILPNKILINRPFFQYQNITDNPVYDLQDIQKLLPQTDDPTLRLVAQEINNNEQRNQEQRKLIETVVNTLQQLGIKIEPLILNRENFAKVINNRQYDLLLSGHSLGTDLDTYSFWHSSQTQSQGLNFSNYINLSTDNLLEKARKTNNQQEKNDLLIAINEKLVYDVPAVFIYTEKHSFAFDNKIKNRIILENYAYISDRFYDVANWTTK